MAGDRLAEGEYVPVEIEEVPDGSLQGYSAALGLNLRWSDGALLFYDPATGEPIATFEDQIARANTEQARAEAAEARVRELEERLRSQGA